MEILEKHSKQFDSNNFPVLKIEEDFDHIPISNDMSKSTQTSPCNELNSIRNHKKGSSNSLWTSDESILRSAETVDEDKSSSACDETGGAISSNKSGMLISSLYLEIYRISLQQTDTDIN